MKYIIFLLCFFIISCEHKSNLDSANDFRCTADQLDMVKKEIDVCAASGFFASNVT